MKNLEKELKALDQAFLEIHEKVPQLKVNSLKAPEDVVALWKIEDAAKNAMYASLSGDGEELILTIESEVGQWLEIDLDAAKALLELNHSKLNLARVAVTEDQRLTVLHRRWLSGISVFDAFDALAEVWNTAEGLREDLRATAPSLA